MLFSKKSMVSRVRAPELPQNKAWLNCDRPLSLAQLKGRIVILDFWTYCCINCLHILPDLKYLEQKYKNWLTAIGVHTAKFDNEQEIDNIRKAILRYDIEHPVIVDRDRHIWDQYAIRAWPTLTVIDPQGYVVGSVSGEGKGEVLDELIGKLIEEHQEKGTIAAQEIQTLLEKQRYLEITPLAFPGKVLADEKSDRLFIADSGHHRIVIATLTGESKQIIGKGTKGLKDGDFNEAQFFSPQGMACDRDRNILYVADTENHAIRKIDLSAETVETIAGTGQQNPALHLPSGKALETPLNSPWDLELIEGEILFIAMAGSHQIWAMDLIVSQIGIYAGSGAEGCWDSSLSEAAFAQPSGISANGEELFVADSEISSIRAVGLEENATVRTVCGSGDLFGFGDRDGIGEEVRLQHCLGMEYVNGKLWVADSYNHKIKRVDPKTGLCETVLGGERAGDRDVQNWQGELDEPGGLSATGSHLYIADTNHHKIRRVEFNTLSISTLEFPGLCAPGGCVAIASE